MALTCSGFEIKADQQNYILLHRCST